MYEEILNFLSMMKKYIKRNKYIKDIKPYIDKELIKVIVGQRRVGKSYLIHQLMDEISRVNKKANIIYINKELYDFDAIKNYHDLLKYVEKKRSKSQKNYLFIDEIQDIEHFEKALRSLSASKTKKMDIYCTGSNANLLSGELATYLSGRYIEIPVFSLSYLEFLEFHQLKEGEDSFFLYIKYGGLPYVSHLELDDEIVYNYLRGVYNTVILKDIVARHNIRNVNFLDRLVDYLADNVGSLVSANKISDFLKSQKVDISPNTVLNYLSYLDDTFFVFSCLRSEIGGKKIFEINEKYYFGDLGLRHSLIGYKQMDINKILENLVFNHLKYLNYSLTVGKLADKEIDFIAQSRDQKIYVQVAYQISSDEVKNREFGNLLKIKDNNPKYVVSMDSFIEGGYKGIKHISIFKFLTTTHL